MKLKLFILALVLAIGFYFRADVLKLYSVLYQKLYEIEKAGIPGIEKFKEDITAIVNSEGQIFAPPPLRVFQEAPSSLLTQKGTIAETNNQRIENNLPALKENVKLNAAAKAKAQDMFARQYFEHVSPVDRGPADLAKSAGYDYLIIGENLALGNFENDKKLVEAWMASPGHRANILNNKYAEIGVAVEKGIYEGESVWMAVQEFGRPASACPKVSEALKIEINNYNIQTDAMAKIIEAGKIELENLRAENKFEYNNKVDEYNDLIRQYNALVTEAKAAVANYNSQVRAYNECLK
ncbi:MAG: CAP domain-containing protein [bacterium]|nr:CAP domain-containing protein [bacterium]